MKQIKYWAVIKEAACYYVNIRFLILPGLVLERNKLKLSKGVEIDQDPEISLGLE